MRKWIPNNNNLNTTKTQIIHQRHKTRHNNTKFQKVGEIRNVESMIVALAIRCRYLICNSLHYLEKHWIASVNRSVKHDFFPDLISTPFLETTPNSLLLSALLLHLNYYIFLKLVLNININLITKDVNMFYNGLVLSVIWKIVTWRFLWNLLKTCQLITENSSQHLVSICMQYVHPSSVSQPLFQNGNIHLPSNFVTVHLFKTSSPHSL